MIDPERWIVFLGWLVVAPPALLLAVLGAASLLERALPEEWTARAFRAAIALGLLASLGIGALMIAFDLKHVPIVAGKWVATPHYHFEIKFLFDPLSVPYALLSFLLCGTIGAFATRYLHREPGFHRFFTLFSLFLLGMVTAALADTIETLFAGWEMVGLASVLLIAFFHERLGPVQNGFRVWVAYRVSDAALLLAAILMHEMVGDGDFDRLVGTAPWPDHQPVLAGGQALLLGLLFLIAAAGKSALIPFSGWLPRAMEGPTPSSAVFYGALSVHLGAFLLLRVAPVFETSPLLSGAVALLGLATALYAYLAGSVQTDIKSSLSFASLAQVGIIVAEIGLGLRYIALIHLLGHACLRTLQFVRAPTLLHDLHTLENAIGARLPSQPHPAGILLPEALRTRLYRFALERGYLDATLTDLVAAPLVRLFRALDALERRWVRFLEGAP